MKFLWDNFFGVNKAEKSKFQILKENFLFRDLSLVELKLVERIVNVRNFRAGEKVFRQGEVGVGMYIICQGSVNVFTEELDMETQTQKPVFVTRLFAGDFFGELALVEENGRRSATVSAHEDSVLIGFFKPDLLEIVNRNPEAGVKILMQLGEVLGSRLRETTQKISELKRKFKEVPRPN